MQTVAFSHVCANSVEKNANGDCAMRMMFFFFFGRQFPRVCMPVDGRAAVADLGGFQGFKRPPRDAKQCFSGV